MLAGCQRGVNGPSVTLARREAHGVAQGRLFASLKTADVPARRHTSRRHAKHDTGQGSVKKNLGMKPRALEVIILGRVHLLANLIQTHLEVRPLRDRLVEVGTQLGPLEDPLGQGVVLILDNGGAGVGFESRERHDRCE